MNTPKSSDFEKALQDIINEATSNGLPFVVVRSGDLHEKVGFYPRPDHRMPVCCNVMRKAMKDKDVILKQPLKCNGTNVEIKYYLNI
jgi:hypothetical protein